MNDVVISSQQLPDNLPDLTKYELIGREKLKSVKAELKVIQGLALAKEVHEQKLREAQDIADAVLDIQTRIGELTAKIPKTSGGAHGNQHTGGKIPIGRNFAKSKNETLKELKIKKSQAYNFEQMAKHPDIVERVKQDARESGEIPTQGEVLRRVQRESHPHTSTKTEEVWEARQRHSDFQKKKKKGVVEMVDALQDKLDKNTINGDLYRRVDRTLREMEWTAMLNTVEDFEGLKEYITPDSRKYYLEKLDIAIHTLTRLREVIRQA